MTVDLDKIKALALADKNWISNATVRELIAEVEQLRNSVEHITHGFKNLEDRHKGAIAEVERLRARFEYIESHATTSGGGHGFEVKFFVPVDCEDIGCGIDAAIAAHTKAGK